MDYPLSDPFVKQEFAKQGSYPVSEPMTWSEHDSTVEGMNGYSDDPHSFMSMTDGHSTMSVSIISDSPEEHSRNCFSPSEFQHTISPPFLLPSPECINMQEAKQLLERRIEHRPSLSDLRSVNIIKDENTTLDARKDMLAKKIQQRPSKQTLEAQNILRNKNFTSTTMQHLHDSFERQHIVQVLNDRLTHRPGALDLVRDGIIVAPEPLESMFRPQDKTSSGDAHSIEPSLDNPASSHEDQTNPDLHAVEHTPCPAPPLPPSLLHVGTSENSQRYYSAAPGKYVPAHSSHQPHHHHVCPPMVPTSSLSVSDPLTRPRSQSVTSLPSTPFAPDTPTDFEKHVATQLQINEQIAGSFERSPGTPTTMPGTPQAMNSPPSAPGTNTAPTRQSNLPTSESAPVSKMEVPSPQVAIINKVKQRTQRSFKPSSTPPPPGTFTVVEWNFKDTSRKSDDGFDGTRPRSRSDGKSRKLFRYHEYKYPKEKDSKAKKIPKRGEHRPGMNLGLPTPRFEALMEQQEQFMQLYEGKRIPSMLSPCGPYCRPVICTDPNCTSCPPPPPSSSHLPPSSLGRSSYREHPSCCSPVTQDMYNGCTLPCCVPQNGYSRSYSQPQYYSQHYPGSSPRHSQHHYHPHASNPDLSAPPSDFCPACTAESCGMPVHTTHPSTPSFPSHPTPQHFEYPDNDSSAYSSYSSSAFDLSSSCDFSNHGNANILPDISADIVSSPRPLSSQLPTHSRSYNELPHLRSPVAMRTHSDGHNHAHYSPHHLNVPRQMSYPQAPHHHHRTKSWGGQTAPYESMPLHDSHYPNMMPPPLHDHAVYEHSQNQDPHSMHDQRSMHEPEPLCTEEPSSLLSMNLNIPLDDLLENGDISSHILNDFNPDLNFSEVGLFEESFQIL